MTRRWMIVLMAMLALAMIGTSGCIRKKKKAPTYDPAADFAGDQVIIGWNADGTPIYGDAGSLGMRMDGAEIGVGQFEAVYFDYDSPQLNPAEQPKIDMVVTYLQANPTHGVIVEGHCDERGSNEYNLALGERRALAVRAALISLGIDGARVQTRSYGEERPVAFGHDESSWRLNRRADFVFTQM
jgi:peptidoglycan-associated lipoprotein